MKKKVIWFDDSVDAADDDSDDKTLFSPRLILSCNKLLHNDFDEDLSLQIEEMEALLP